MGGARLLVLICIVSYFTAVPHSTFTSVSKIEACAELETRLMEVLQKYMDTEEKENRTIPVRLKVFADTVHRNLERNENPETISHSPISAFHLIDRFVNGWASVTNCSSCLGCLLLVLPDSFKELCRSVSAIQDGTENLPEVSDLRGSTVALLRLHKIYDIDLGQLIDGEINNVRSEPLSVTQVSYISKVAQELGMFAASMTLLENTYKRIEFLRNNIFKDDTIVEIYRDLAAVYYKYGWTDRSIDVLLKIHQGNIKVQTDMAWYRERWLEHPEGILDPVTVATVPDDIFTNYKALCQGQILRDVVETSRLKCFWRITRIPVLRSKEEVLSYDPRVSIYHDVISDAESKIVMDIASSKLQRSMTLKPDGNPGSTDNDQRISQTAWLPDETSPIVRKLSRRVSSIINMDMDQRISQSGCEELQILNYGVGGMYEPHYDYLQIPDEADTREGDPANVYNSGDRIATWLFYMTDVEAGGYTVFPNIKVQVPVTKGGAAFWYNLKRNGEMDPRTLHAGCPILLGSKWVCNKWIRSRNQMFRRPCGLSVDALDGPQS